MNAVRGAWMRGGSSKGLFVLESDLPTEPEKRNSLILALLGSPDPMQIDGLGGARPTTSKFAYVGPSTAPDVDLEYAVAAVGIRDSIVDWSGTCGNLTSAVVPFALEFGLLDLPDGEATVRLLNRSTGGLIDITLTVMEGKAADVGTSTISGVPGTNSPIHCRYLNPAGGTFGSMFPTGSVVDEVRVGDELVPTTVIDVTHPYAFISAAALGTAMDPLTVNARPDVLEHLEKIRAEVAVRLGAAISTGDASLTSPSVPRLVIVNDEHSIEPGGPAIEALAVSMGEAIESLPATAAFALASAMKCDGSVPAGHRSVHSGENNNVEIRYPRGVSEVSVHLEAGHIEYVEMVRTARVLMSGVMYLPGSITRSMKMAT